MPDDAPDVYADGFRMNVGPYGVTMIFELTPKMPIQGQTSNETKVVVRMSLEHAKVMAMMMRRNLKQFELEMMGDPINLPRALLSQLKLSPDEW